MNIPCTESAAHGRNIEARRKNGLSDQRTVRAVTVLVGRAGGAYQEHQNDDAADKGNEAPQPGPAAAADVVHAANKHGDAGQKEGKGCQPIEDDAQEREGRINPGKNKSQKHHGKGNQHQGEIPEPVLSTRCSAAELDITLHACFECNEGIP